MISIEQLSQKNLMPLKHCLIVGKESYLREKALLLIDQAIEAQQLPLPHQFHLDVSGFDWSRLWSICQNGGLFDDTSLVILRSQSALKKAQHDKLNQLIESNYSTIFIVLLNDLSKTQQKERWYKVINQQGLVIKTDPIPAYKFGGWVKQKFKQAGFDTSMAGYALIEQGYQGNLLGLDKLIEILNLSCPTGFIDESTLSDYLSNQAVYSVFQCVDSALAGNLVLVEKMLQQLKAEKVQPAIIAWQIANELRQLVNMRFTVQQGQSIASVLNHFQIWQSKKSLFTKQLQTHSLAKCYQLLQQAKQLDETIKGLNSRDPWSELHHLLFQIASI